MKKFIRMHVTYDIPIYFVNEDYAEDFFDDLSRSKIGDQFDFFENSADKIPVAIDTVYMGDEDDISD